MNKKIQTNIVYDHIVNGEKKIIVQQGGTRSGKTYNILIWILDYYSRHSDKTITIVRKTFPAVRGTVMRDFFDILKKYNLYFQELHSERHTNILKYKSCRIYFFGSANKDTRKKEIYFLLMSVMN